MGFLKKKKNGGSQPAMADLSALSAEKNAAINDLNVGANNARTNLNTAISRFNPNATQKLFNQSLDRFSNFDQTADKAGQAAYDANYQPILTNIQAQLGNQFAGMGEAGRNNSRGQFAQAVLSNQLADNAGKQLLDIRNNARNQVLQENQALFNPAMDIQQQLVGIDTNKANINSQLGQNLANTRLGVANNTAQMQQQNAQMQAQLAAQKKSQKKSGIGSAIGGAVSLAGSLFSDLRLKENVRQIGKLSNGIPIYTYNIKGSELPQIGVLAQEAQLYRPNAVSMDKSGYLKVDYAEVAR